MKKFIIIALGCFGIISATFGQCVTCGGPYMYGYEYVCRNNCNYTTCQSEFCPYATRCQCTDEGWRWNDCISHCKYCEAFGNVGGR